MKRFLALLLVLLLPTVVLAETYLLSIDFEVDGDRLTQYASLMGQNQPEADQYLLIVQLVDRILNESGIDVVYQEDAVYFDVHIGRNTLLDMTIHDTPEAAYLTSSLIPGYAIVAEADPMVSNAQADLEQMDWTKIGASLEGIIRSWLDDLEPVVQHGAFSGDAYEGGTTCTTWTLCDRDIAELLSSLMTEEVCQFVSLYFTAMGYDGEQVLNDVDEMHESVSKKNDYTYVIRIVKDADENVIGISVTLLHKNNQVATLSIGLKKNELRFVAGLGMPEQNYWMELTVNYGTGRNTTYLSGQCREWFDDKNHGFAYVCEKSPPISDCYWNCNIMKSGNQYMWDATSYEDMGNSQYAYLFSSNGSVSAKPARLDGEISVGGGQEKLITMNVKCKPTEAIDALGDGLVYCSMTDPEQAGEYDHLMTQMSSSIAAKLLKLLPMDLIFQLGAPALP